MRGKTVQNLGLGITCPVVNHICSGAISATFANVAQTYACICLLSMGSFTTPVCNSRENPAMHKSRLQAFYFYFYLLRMMMKLLVVLSPAPALCCLQFVGYWKISPTTDKKIREELMVFLCHYRNKLIFGFKSEGGESQQHVSGDVSKRDGTVASKLI